MKHSIHIAVLFLSLACGGLAESEGVQDVSGGLVQDDAGELQAPQIAGSVEIDPARLEGLTLKMMVEDSTATTPFQVQFSAATVDGILSQINAKTVGRIVASAPDGRLVLTAEEPGPEVMIGVFGGTALEALGLTARTYVSGE